eukprot:scaffold235453_cov40-Tisochrysis_lutea.AAC.1
MSNEVKEEAVEAAPAVQVSLEPLVLVAGETYQVRDQLKAIGGGTWCKPLGGWVFPDDKRATIMQVLDKAGLSHRHNAPGASAANKQESAAVNAAAAKDASSTACAGATLTVAPHKRALLVTGETMKVKDVLKSLHGSWNKTLKGWVFPGSQRATLLETLRADASNTVTEASASQSPAAKRQKKSAEDEFIDDDESE